MFDAPSPRSEGGVVHLVRLEGDSSPFDVVEDDSLAPLRVGAQGPPVRFEVPVEVAELLVPGQVSVPPRVRFGDTRLTTPRRRARSRLRGRGRRRLSSASTAGSREAGSRPRRRGRERTGEGGRLTCERGSG